MGLLCECLGVCSQVSQKQQAEFLDILPPWPATPLAYMGFLKQSSEKTIEMHYTGNWQGFVGCQLVRRMFSLTHGVEITVI